MKYFETQVRPKHSKRYLDGFILKTENEATAKKLLRKNGFSISELTEIGTRVYSKLDNPPDYRLWDHKTFDENCELTEYEPKATGDMEIILKLESKSRNMMKDTKATIKPTIETLERLFTVFNNEIFEGELEKPVITVSADTVGGAYGWATGWRAWQNIEDHDSEGYFEINVCADYLNRNPEEIAETLLHEMVHIYNSMKDVKDTSRSGKYHNKAFKAAAEKFLLNVEKDSKYGFCKTSFSEKAKELFKEKISNWFYFDIYRPTPSKGQKVTRKSSMRKYVCPVCGTIIRATKEVHITCTDCGVEFEEVE